MASRNEYSKKRLGEISTAAYKTSLENTKYRNRCRQNVDPPILLDASQVTSSHHINSMQSFADTGDIEV
ncbi:hypothetical protein ABFA07_012551 [Porites harrisoni]